MLASDTAPSVGSGLLVGQLNDRSAAFTFLATFHVPGYRAVSAALYGAAYPGKSAGTYVACVPCRRGERQIPTMLTLRYLLLDPQSRPSQASPFRLIRSAKPLLELCS